MHPQRLSYLAYNNAQRRAIVSKERDETGAWNLALECGHNTKCVAHMNPADDWRCMPCGEKWVLSQPRYQKEFSPKG